MLSYDIELSKTLFPVILAELVSQTVSHLMQVSVDLLSLVDLLQHCEQTVPVLTTRLVVLEDMVQASHLLDQTM